MQKINKTNNLKILKELSVLIVEDDTELLNNLKDTIEIFTPNVYCATDGKEALTYFNEQHIDLLIIDYVMPNMDGVELCKEIRLKNPYIPILMISNYSDNEKLLKSIPLNLTKYLIKPVSYDDLINTIVDMIEKLKEQGKIEINISQNIKYNSISKILTNNKKQVKLTKNETLLLDILIKNRNILVSNSTLEYGIDNNGLSTQAIKNLIHRMRVKIGKDSIINIKGLGYMLVFTS